MVHKCPSQLVNNTNLRNLKEENVTERTPTSHSLQERCGEFLHQWLLWECGIPLGEVSLVGYMSWAGESGQQSSRQPSSVGSLSLPASRFLPCLSSCLVFCSKIAKDQNTWAARVQPLCYSDWCKVIGISGLFWFAFSWSLRTLNISLSASQPFEISLLWILCLVLYPIFWLGCLDFFGD